MRFLIISCEMLEKYLALPDILLLDLREKAEYENGHISGAEWGDWETLEETMPQLLKKLTYTPSWIILYCTHGNTSLLTARDLARNGYPVISLNGGYAAWEKYMSRKAK